MPVVIFFACLDLEQKSSFMDGHWLIWLWCNQRKSRKGAFWEDRYHATAVAWGIIHLECI